MVSYLSSLNPFREVLTNIYLSKVKVMCTDTNTSLQYWVRKKYLIVYLQRKYSYIPCNMWNNHRSIKMKYFVKWFCLGRARLAETRYKQRHNINFLYFGVISHISSYIGIFSLQIFWTEFCNDFHIFYTSAWLLLSICGQIEHNLLIFWARSLTARLGQTQLELAS